MKILGFIAIVYGILTFSITSTQAADTQAGRNLHQEHCISCHASLMDGEPSLIYTRTQRRVKSYQGLVTQVRRCKTTLGLQWVDKDVDDVSAFLNETYYEF